MPVVKRIFDKDYLRGRYLGKSFTRLKKAFVCPRLKSRANFTPNEIFGPNWLQKLLSIKTTKVFSKKKKKKKQYCRRETELKRGRFNMYAHIPCLK